ncbi:MAG: hypothetical protein LUQ09_01060 [Methanomassiliicoccales archaeon]|nr:hypothetical protein [Methanomassiliicoccales archaeon]
MLEIDDILLKSNYVGLKAKDIRWDPKAAARATDAFQRFTGYDITMPGMDNIGIIRDLGLPTTEPENNTASPTGVLFQIPEDIDTKNIFDPMDPKQTPWMNKSTFEKVALSKALIGDRAILSGLVPGVMSMAAYLRGAEQLMMGIMVEPEITSKIVDRAAHLCDGIMSRYVQEGIELPFLGDPVASEDLIPESIFRSYVFEPTKNIISHVKGSYKVPMLMHICGDTQNICKLTPEMGVDIFSVDSKIDLAHYKRTIGEKVVIAGAVPTIQVMLNGTPEIVRESARSCIEKAGHGGGFILTTACGIPKDTPFENLTMLRTAAEEFTPMYQ